MTPTAVLARFYPEPELINTDYLLKKLAAIVEEHGPSYSSRKWHSSDSGTKTKRCDLLEEQRFLLDAPPSRLCARAPRGSHRHA
jgi:hypothetical protein